MREFAPPRRASLGVALFVATATLAGCSSSYEPFTAEGTEDAPDDGLVKGIMAGIGAIDPKDKPIEYRPRAALVVPPKKDLRAPENADAALAAKQFPVNPEDRRVDAPRIGSDGRVMSLAEQERFASVPRIEARLPSVSPEEASKPLRPDQLAGVPTADVALSPAAQRKKTLLDPPKDYATPNANVPFEEAKPKETSWKPSWWPL